MIGRNGDLKDPLHLPLAVFPLLCWAAFSGLFQISRGLWQGRGDLQSSPEKEEFLPQQCLFQYRPSSFAESNYANSNSDNGAEQIAQLEKCLKRMREVLSSNPWPLWSQMLHIKSVIPVPLGDSVGDERQKQEHPWKLPGWLVWCMNESEDGKERSGLNKDESMRCSVIFCPPRACMSAPLSVHKVRTTARRRRWWQPWLVVGDSAAMATLWASSFLAIILRSSFFLPFHREEAAAQGG